MSNIIVETIAEKIQSGILEDVTDRRGWEHEWYNMDEDIQKEIKESWIKIITDILEAEEGK